MAKFKMKKRSKGDADPVEINVTPMIDMFSVLNTFLLMTSVFSAVGQIPVEVPFLSSKPPPPQEELDKNPQKSVTVTIDDALIKMEIFHTNSSANTERLEYTMTEKGLDDLQAKLYSIRQGDARFDKVTLMTLPETKMDSMVQVLDSMRELKAGRPPIPWPTDYKLPAGIGPDALIPKIVLGNVIL